MFETVTDTLHSLIRKQTGREESPSLGIMSPEVQRSAIRLILNVKWKGTEKSRAGKTYHFQYARTSV